MSMPMILFTKHSEATHRTFSHGGIAVDAVVAEARAMLGLIERIQGLLPS
jgi:hypothetical protein